MPHALIAAVALAFVLASSPARGAPCAGFTDVENTSPFCVNVTWMKSRGITLGCTATLYCPNNPVTRLQMAAFMYRLGFQNAFLQGGNSFGATAVLGTDDAQAVEVHANNARVMRYEPNAISPNVIGGSPANSVTAGVRGATIAGGGVPVGNTDPDFGTEAPNSVIDAYGTVGGGYANRAGGGNETTTDSAFATVGGGWANTAAGYASTIGGGALNVAVGPHSTVGGGQENIASGAASTVGGGTENTASGNFGTVAGGLRNTASAILSFAAGWQALADQDQCFVFANWFSLGGGSCRGSKNIARFMVDHGLSVDYFARRFDGSGLRWIYLGDLFTGQSIATWTGAFLSDSGVWTNNSDRTQKDGFTTIDTQAVLEGVVNLPIARWHYRHDSPGVEHIGPTAQDFKAAFGLGQSDKAIGTVDADGVALAAIQGLNAKVEAQAKEIAAQAREVAELRRLVEKMVAAR